MAACASQGRCCSAAARERPPRAGRRAPWRPARTHAHAPAQTQTRARARARTPLQRTAKPHAARGARRTIGVGIEESPVKHCASRLPAGRASRSPHGLPASAGIRAGGAPARLPARTNAQWPALACIARETRPSRPASNDAAAYRCGGSAGERRPGERAHSCFPFNRACHARAPRRRQFRSGPRERQESRPPGANPAHDPRIRSKKQGCYDWKRYRCRNARYSALKCWVFRGRSRCSTNSKPYLKILAG